ncbi:rhodanese-like domain-containing protein [Oxalobacter sp. OttesenSCG-928-P03]|nr:rhodanese-like domain-containing protein [Oxalobacter sp. OttesenSCG-928-P03]
MKKKVGYKQLLEEAEKNITSLEVEEALRLHQEGKAKFLDLRDIREIERDGYIAGSFHCPRGLLEFWIDPESPYHKPIFAEPHYFVFYCAGGWRSALATQTAQMMGLSPVAHIRGGFGAWTKQNCPVEKYKQK